MLLSGLLHLYKIPVCSCSSLNLFSCSVKRNPSYVGGHYHSSPMTSPLYNYPSTLERSPDKRRPVALPYDQSEESFYTDPDYDGVDTLEYPGFHSASLPQRRPAARGESLCEKYGTLPRADDKPIFVTTIIL